jgi:hypothetical protein
VDAQSPQSIPAYPLYCHGPLTTGPLVGTETTTPFVWAPTGAGDSSPGPGMCVWADRPARGSEIQTTNGGNVICDFSGAMKNVSADTFVEIGVARDPIVNNCMHLTRYLGTVSPPFSGTPALPPFVRQSIAGLTPAQIASLQKGIATMMARPVTDPTSYRFQANIHGTTDLPTTPQQNEGWNQCEHGSFYFLSWHRMYLYFFDRILRAAAGDPNLVLPYWNWTDPAQRTLPAPFQNTTSSLYIAAPGRPAALDNGTAAIGAGAVAYSAAFADTNFESPSGSGSSFGGQVASPVQFNAPHGDFESQPHDVVHVALGGLMGDPDTAAQDPIFWLHHANIDRMWNDWLRQGGGRADSTDAAWLNTRFTFFDEAGHAVYLTGSEIINDVNQLNYEYDDEPSQEPGIRPPRFPQPPNHFVAKNTPSNETSESRPRLSLTSDTRGRLPLDGVSAHVNVPLTKEAVTRLHVLRSVSVAKTAFLRFDDIRFEKSVGVYYEVYLNPPKEPLSIHTRGYVGNLSLFGLKPHQMNGRMSAMPVNGVFVQYDISQLIRTAVDASDTRLSVVLVPRGLFDLHGDPLPVPATTQGTVGSIQIILLR